MCDIMRFGARLRCWAGATFAAALAVMLAAAPAAALSEAPGEAEALKACEKKLCTMILDRPADGADLACDVQKTWAKESLEKGKDKGVSWGFGDARCTVNLKLSRADIVGALTNSKHKIFVPAHEVHCVVERDGQQRPVVAKVAPKLVFKNGKADKVWINLESIEGPSDIKSTIWAAANLEDKIGIFHRPMIKQINKFVHAQCAKRYGPDAHSAEKKEDAKPTKVAADKAIKQVGKAKQDVPAKASTSSP